MSIRSKLTLVTLSAFIAIYSIVGGLLSNSNSPWVKAIADPGPYPQLRIFEEVVRHIVNDYVEKPNLEKVRIGALRGLTEALDPYSAYLLPQQVKEYQQTKDQPDLTGMVIGQYSDFAYVIAVVPGAPADKAGIRVGDMIEYIDGHATRDLIFTMSDPCLRGTSGPSIEITLINRRSEKIKLVRGAVPSGAPEIRALEQQIGYIKVPILVKGQAEAVKKAVNESIKKGAQRIILDLRGSAGGDLKEGIEVANLFLKSGTIAKVIGRKDKVLLNTTLSRKRQSLIFHLLSSSIGQPPAHRRSLPPRFLRISVGRLSENARYLGWVVNRNCSLSMMDRRSS